MTAGTGRRRAAILAYDGEPFAGWQRQPDRRTVQGDLEATLERILGQPVGVVGAGRTDAGVHAWSQVAHFDDPLGLPPDRLATALNGKLPSQIRVRHLAAVPDDFHALGWARDKTYVYSLYRSERDERQRAVDQSIPPLRRPTSVAVRASIDVGAMRRAARDLVGRHDFLALSKAMPAGRETIKTVSCVRILHAPRGLRIVVTAEGFLYGMVRLMAGLLVEIGQGARPADGVGALLTGRDRSDAPASLPGRGLMLLKVRYDQRPGGTLPARLLS